MRKLLALSSACIITCIFISSCSNLSIAKRHYRKGFYIEYAKHTQSTIKPISEEKKLVHDKRIMQFLPAFYPPKQSTNQKGASLNPAPSDIIIAAKNGKTQHKILSEQGAKQLPKENNSIAKSPTAQLQPAFSQGSEYNGDSGGRSALSLLWIVIIVVLILWLIGILAGDFGLGALINILLVVALILLILWLLRIA